MLALPQKKSAAAESSAVLTQEKLRAAEAHLVAARREHGNLQAESGRFKRQLLERTNEVRGGEQSLKLHWRRGMLW